MAGMANKNENLAAPFPEVPKAIAVVMVIPDREMPGIIATACANPMMIPLFNDMGFDPDFNRLEKNRTNPVKMSAPDTN